ncbi:MAG: hypothetical protein COV74_04650 [Candidatus Omnitrophica bacterium CG11_big_fil_rev_8_21_14_0_20_45_26]|uniref:Chlorite dismutase n=1 Tax=Candidatus Abzuiibacterium crystallinum TaxID=1974748 RepID=A0A2H0LPV9_9BACT|nr:MAG: hypothetical protein COV74_04650 [Candidatus Omnitrophica bacterium CG11_big_fil_rev_8_21_14_0_20_45_26]PIW64052.1 MAG: hypothetical protein COW12_07775 [Candidatus Omnitrophica bacterium CG12_big_fil_rev_8_21_14_0_65_45_16]
MKPSIQSETIDIRETGGPKQGEPQKSNRRLFCLFQAFSGCLDSTALIASIKTLGLDSVLYEEVNDPHGIGLLVMHENPAVFVDRLRPLLNKPPFADCKLKPALTMLGRTYALGREQNLEDWLIEKPKRTTLNPEWPWAIWYPLRRKPEFELLPREEQSKILYEHAKIGIAFGEADFAHDVRLACHGLDQNDNDFVIGLIGKELYPLSRVVQEMRKTQQTAKYLQSLGPFFIGRVKWQSPSSTQSA